MDGWRNEDVLLWRRRERKKYREKGGAELIKSISWLFVSLLSPPSLA